MLRNYFNIAKRSLIKNRLSSLINIFGLAIGLAAAILIFLLIKQDLDKDKFHHNLADIHLLMMNQPQEGRIFTGSSTCGPLADALRGQLPEITHIARTSSTSRQLLTYGDKSIYEQGMFAEPDFFNIFRFPAVMGSPISALQETGNIIITEATAHKLFGDENAVGKIIRHNNEYDLKVAAVIRDIPANSSLRFNVVLPFRMFEQQNQRLVSEWNSYILATYVSLQPGVNMAALNKKLTAIILPKTDNKDTRLFAYPYHDLQLFGSFKNGKPNGGRIEIIILLSAIGLFILLIACVNFMNLSTARSMHRAREVGVRKTLGASRRQVILQFLTEALTTTLAAFILAVLFAWLILPSINHAIGGNLTLSFTDWQTVGVLLGLAVLTGLVSGSYPAFFLSAFEPVRVLKGVTGNGKKGGLLRKGLVTFQFIISIALIITTIVIFKQQAYIENRPIGYEQDNLVEIPASGDMGNGFAILKEELLQIPGIKSVSASTDNMVQYGGATNDINWPGKTADQNFMINISHVQYDWARTTGARIIAGRDFSTAYGSDSLGVILNQAAVKRMGLKEPVIGAMLGNYAVIGVVADFSFNDAFNSPGPLAVYLGTGGMNHFFIRLANNDHWQQTMARVEKTVKKHHPSYPFEFHFTKDIYEKKFTGIRATGQVLSLTGILAIFISCLGLFGLSAFLAERRTKEIGIRKVFGAGVAKIWLMLSWEFIKPVLIAFVVAAPLAGWGMHMLLTSFEYHINLSWWMFAAGGVTALVVALATVSWQGIRAALIPPAESLRAE
ncbi:ABC transporter permease [Chitinophaga agrisoli]|nr:ABC transporter permease [Chitinophaga agrisoli]